MAELQATTNRTQRIADLIVLLLLAGLVGWYCYDAVKASTHVYNLIFVLPVALIVLVLCAVQFALGLRDGHAETKAVEPVTTVLPIVGLFAIYVLTLPWLGFDVGTCLFLLASLRIHGERRWPWLAAYSVAFAFSLAVFFSKMLPYPMPMLLLPTAY